MRLGYTIDPERVAANHRRNVLHAFVLGASLVGLLALVGWFIAGVPGLIWIGAFAVVAVSVGPQVSQRLLLQIYSASELNRQSVPLLYELAEGLARRAGLSAEPRLFYIPSRLMLAFTVGKPNDFTIAVSDGLLRGLGGREIAAVLAHELSHVAQGDLRLMALADFVTKVTRTLTLLALILIAINIPYLADDGVPIPWSVIAALAFVPLVSLLLQLALSRSREYDADVGAATLTGDPEAVASALQKMDAQQKRAWEAFLGRRARLDQPSLLRSHPATDERVQRLAELAVPNEPTPEAPDDLGPPNRGEVTRPPRRRLTGYRY